MMKNINDEGIKVFIDHNRSLKKANLNKALLAITAKLEQNLDKFGNKFPSAVSKNNIYSKIDNNYWTTAFWTGMLWLAYDVTNEKKYYEKALIHISSFKERIEKQVETNTHDLGFLYTLSCIAAYKLIKSAEAKNTALRAADLLMTRYFDKAGIIQAWGDLNNPHERGRLIIDCLMNLPLLYWAYNLTGNKKYFTAAYNHGQNTLKYLIREDASSFHTFYMDVDTGEPKYGKTAQGFSDSSCWARGQAWAIYGLTLSYIYSLDAEFINTAKKVANYFINRLPEDYVCYWDLVFTRGNEERDSSAAAIAACGLLELAKRLPNSDKDKKSYKNLAQNIFINLTANYLFDKNAKADGIIMHSVYSKPDNKGIDECTIWGDYFYFELLVRLLKEGDTFW